MRLAAIYAAWILLALAPAPARAENFGFGWQYTGPASGFSLRFPLNRGMAIQPIMAMSLRDQDQGKSGRLQLGLRGLLNLPSYSSIHPYIGAGYGHASRYAAEGTNQTGGYQVFLGLEYQRSDLRPSIEVALGRIHGTDRPSYLGTMINCGVHYYF